MKTNEQSRLIECFSTVFPTLTEEQILDLDQAAFAQWDSIATVTLVAVIEEAFQMEFPVDQMENLVSFQSFCHLVTGTAAHSASQ